MKKWKKRYIVLAVVLVFFCLVAYKLATNMPQVFSLAHVDFSQLEDGVYEGYCDNGLVTAQVTVTVENQRVTSIVLNAHNNGLGKAAEVITEHVVAAQSMQVDSVSGATYSSSTILKAIEDALTVKELP